MKIVLTGSLGHIGSFLVPLLIAKNHEVIVISSKKQRIRDIEQLNAVAAVGSVTDFSFLAKTFSGADAVYTMVPPPSDYFNPAFNASVYNEAIRTCYYEALLHSNVKRVINLSSWGAHRTEGTGGIIYSHLMEEQLNQLPDDVSVTHIRPTSFYYNLLAFIPMIKHEHEIKLNYGGEDRVAVVATSDIAEAIAEEFDNMRHSRHIRYVASDETTCSTMAKVLGAAIGMPQLQWKRITFEEARNRLLTVGLPQEMASSVAEIQEAIHNGKLAEHYNVHKPVLGKIKIEDFAREFAEIYRKS